MLKCMDSCDDGWGANKPITNSELSITCYALQGVSDSIMFQVPFLGGRTDNRD